MAIIITPKTHPTFFRNKKELVGCNEYFTPIFISSGMDEDLLEACVDAYKKAKPDEIADGVDHEKYKAWAETREGIAATDRIYANKLFVTEDGDPISDEDYYLRERGQLARAVSFTRRPLTNSTEELPTTTANGDVSPASEEKPSASQS